MQRMPVDINDLESLGELGHGTCGQVIKMQHRRSGHLMAVKVCVLKHLNKIKRSVDRPTHGIIPQNQNVYKKDAGVF